MLNKLIDWITSIFSQAKTKVAVGAQAAQDTLLQQVKHLEDNIHNALEAVSVDSLVTGQYATIWGLLPGKPIEGSMIFLVASGMSQISDFLNPNTRFTLNGKQRNANPLEMSLLNSLADAATNQPCTTLYLIYDYTLINNPLAQVWAVLQTLNSNTVFIRSRADATGTFVFTQVQGT